MIEKFFFLFYLIPLFSCLLLVIGIRFSEKFVINISFATLLIPCVTSLLLLTNLLISSHFPAEIELFSFFIDSHKFIFSTWIDFNSLIFLFLTHILGLFVVKYSHAYLNLEKGFQRFFATIQLFIFGMYILSLAGSIDLFFAGWEIVGLSSFLLIAFYRAHNRSVINAWRIFNIYKVCDLGLLIGAVMGQALFHDAAHFSYISSLTPEKLSVIPESTLIFISLFMIIAATGKSAQFPFYNWPSRAMEGPTPSSAIFYGALSIHAGVFLLIRTSPIWSSSTICEIVIFCIGFITVFLSSIQAKVQANIKGQIAYSITSQIGIIFIELSLGFYKLAVIHLFLHALYRCFQLLVSPSVVLSSLLGQNSQLKERLNSKKSWLDYLPHRIKTTLYLLASTEFEFDNSWRGFNFLGWKKVFNSLKGLSQNIKWYTLISIIIFLLFTNYDPIPKLIPCISIYLTLIALVVSNFPFNSIINLTIATTLNLIGAYFINVEIQTALMFYTLPWFVSSTIGLYITFKYKNLNLSQFHALGHKSLLMANMFFICFIILSGMPFTTIFLAEDMILEKFIDTSNLFTFSLAFNFMTMGIIYAKVYTRLFMGRPTKYFHFE